MLTTREKLSIVLALVAGAIAIPYFASWVWYVAIGVRYPLNFIQTGLLLFATLILSGISLRLAHYKSPFLALKRKR
jgi:hypothetical protein